MFQIWVSGRIRPGYTQTPVCLCFSDEENTHQRQAALTAPQRKRSIKQQVRLFTAALPKTWLRLHCRSFVEEDKRAAPAEIPQPCNRNHVYDFHNIERKRKCSGHFWLYNLKKMEGGGDVISHVNMSKPLGLFSVFKPFFANSKNKTRQVSSPIWKSNIYHIWCLFFFL